MKAVNVTVLIMLALAVGLMVVAYLKDPGLPLEGFKDGWKMFFKICPVMIIAFIAAATLSKIIPTELMTQWLGEDSGFRGLAIATLAGSLTPGGPFVQFPIIAALYKSGVAVGPLMTYISAWALLGVNRFLIFEVSILGWKLSLCRIGVSLCFPFMIGFLTQIVWNRLR